VTVLQGNGVRDDVPRARIKKMVSTKLSLMPEGLEEGLSEQELADLVNFVRRSAP
jgi:putative heme-binding domain-containing protein